MVDKNGFKLSRRKILAGLGSIGVASAGVGLGTSAYFSDEETFKNNQLVAGELDMYVAFEEHYSDWSDDEDDGLEGDVRMENGTALSDPSRVGLPANVAPMISVLNESEANQFLNNTVNSTYPEGYDALEPVEDPCGENTPLQDGTEMHPAAIQLADVKPGDFGEVTFSFALCDNPGYVWATGGLVSANENDLTEPERKDPDEKEGVVELLDVVRAAVWVDDGNNFQNPPEAPAVAGTLREVLEALETGAGIPVDPVDETEARNCFDAETVHNVVFAWWVPVDHGNEIQTDSARFDLGFYTEQCRHNDPATEIDLPVEDVYIGYEDRKAGDFDYNDFGMDANITETYIGAPQTLAEIQMSFEARFHTAGDSHDIHIERELPGSVEYDYDVSRSNSASGNETAAGNYTGESGTLDVVLFDTDDFSKGETVTIDVTITDGSESPPTSSPRSDVAANNVLFEVYDPYMDDRTIGSERHIEDFQPATTEFPLTDDYDVPYILVVPVTNFTPPGEGTTIDDKYSEFDEYYKTRDSQYEDWYSTT
jgi:LruC domain-containing protein/predicted ribosomally synthesized peptide with SipW-like signal peptide